MSEEHELDFDVDALPDPEDYLAGHGEYAFVGLYMRVYCGFTRMTWNYTKIVRKTGRLGENARAYMAAQESKLETWLARADEIVPDWFDTKILGYPEDDEV